MSNVQTLEDLFQISTKIILKNQDGKILLLQNNWKNEICWDLPGGRIQRNEHESIGILRELKEETGICNISDLQHLGLIKSDVRLTTHDSINVGVVFAIFSAMTPETSVCLSSEHCHYDWVDQQTAIQLLGDDLYNQPLKKFLNQL